MASTSNILVRDFVLKPLGYPGGVTIDHNRNIVVSDVNNHKINVFNYKGEFLYSFGSKGKREGEFRYPTAICHHEGHILICDTHNNRIQIFNSEGVFHSSFGKYGSKEGQFIHPCGIICDKDGYIFISDSGNNRIQVFNIKNEFLFSFGNEYLSTPGGMACDDNGNIIIADTNNHRIQAFKLNMRTYKADFRFSFGSEGTEEGKFYYPSGIAIDHDGNYLICDTMRHRIQVFKLISQIPKFIHSFGSRFNEEGKQNNFTNTITVDHDGNCIVFINNNRIQIFKGPSDVRSLFSLCWKKINKYKILE